MNDAIAVACCQVAPRIGDLTANREMIAEVVSAAASAGAQIIVLPELVSSGYTFSDRAEAVSAAEPVDGATVELWQRLSAELGVVIVGGFPELTPSGELFNSAALVDSGTVRAVYRKAHLWDAERVIFAAGDAAPPVVGTRYGSVGVLICYDLEFPEWVRLPALDGAHLLCAPVNWPASPRPAGERSAEVVRVQANASVNRMFIAACDRTGEERGVDWVGGSAIVDADGWPMALADSAADPVTIVAECRLSDASEKSISRYSNVHGDRRPEIYGRLT